ncbi:MAG: shikimate kinase [Zoogloeaceae bacterium]|nr:shikimate kinase [Zoogloeaceae bacterium]
MGSGKTTLGRQLARRLEWTFFDSDHEIEARTGVRIPTIFDLEGEAGFRRREAQVIDALTRQRHVVLATGGGAVTTEANRRALRESGWVAYLDVAPEVLWERTRYDRNRPLLQVENPLETLRDLHARRDPLYRETAHFVLESRTLQSQFFMLHRLLKEFLAVCEH